MTTTLIRREQASIAPRRPTSRLLLGEDSVLAPKTEFELGMRSDDPDRARQIQVHQAIAGEAADELMRSAANAALRRAERFSGSSLAWSQGGFACLAAGKLDDALGAFERALTIEPQLRGARLGLARTFLQLGSHEQCLTLLRELHSDWPNDAEIVVSLAVAIADNETADEALAVLEAAQPSRPSAHFYAIRGGLRVAAGRHSEAVGDLRKAIAARPDWSTARNVLGLAEFKLGRLAAAEKQFRQATKLARSYEEPFLNLLRVLGAQSRYEEVLSEADRRFSPDKAPAIVGRIVGSACFQLEKWKEAITWLTSAIEKTTDSEFLARVHNDLGCAYSRIENQVAAGRHFELSTNQSFSEIAFVNRARVYLLDNQPTLAIGWLTQSRQESENPSYERLKVLAGAFAQAGFAQQAVEIGHALIESERADVDAYALLTALLVDELGDCEMAIDVAERGLAIYPRAARLLNNLSYALLMLDRVSDAEAILSVSPDRSDESDRAALMATNGLLALKQGNLGRGRQLYETAIANAPTDRMRARLRAKRDLEVGRALLVAGDRDEASRLFKRAAAEDPTAAPYRQHAQQELKRLAR